MGQWIAPGVCSSLAICTCSDLRVSAKKKEMINGRRFCGKNSPKSVVGNDPPRMKSKPVVENRC